MPQRIAEYQIELIKVENSGEENNKNFIIPLIIPLVLYASSTSNWNVHTHFTDVQPVLAGYENLGIGNYDVLDINKFKTEKLLNSSLFLYRVLCIEKVKSLEDLTNILSYLLEHEQNENHKNLLKDIIRHIFKDALQSENVYQYFNSKEEVHDMSVIEMVLKEKNDLLAEGERRGERKGLKAGLQKGIEKITIEMLKQNLDDTLIMQITKIDANSLEKLKKKTKIS